jgi:hypothetical protein
LMLGLEQELTISGTEGNLVSQFEYVVHKL